MPVHLRLVHAEPGSRVVEASAVRQGEVLAMALGEGATAEAAEERARQRLQLQLREGSAVGSMAASGDAPPAPARPSPEAEDSSRVTAPAPAAESGSPGLPVVPGPAAVPAPVPAAATAAAIEEPPEEPPADPEDWSGELARIDLALKRIGWQRQQEELYLERAFGHPSRGRITRYGDLLAYLQHVEQLEPGSDPLDAPVPLRRSDLLSQSDALLRQLGWDAHQGRQFLERHLGRASRQQLSEAQLLQFNMLLEEAVLAAEPTGQRTAAD